MKAEENQIIIHSKYNPRQGWDTLLAAMAENADDRLLDEPLLTRWDDEEWLLN